MDSTIFNKRLRDIFYDYADDQMEFYGAREALESLCEQRLEQYVIDGPPDEVLSECFNAHTELYRRAYDIDDIHEHEFREYVTTSARRFFDDPELRDQHEQKALALITAEAA